MRPIRLILVALLLSTHPSDDTMAQVVRGTVLEEGTGKALEGAFVILRDEQGARQGAALTNAQGAYIIRSPGPGRYTLRLERIGFRSNETSLLELSPGQTLVRDFLAPVEPIRLEGITASGSGRCETTREMGAATSVLWEEARKAVSVSEWARTDPGVPYQTLSYQRGRNVVSGRIDEQTARIRSGYGTSAFKSESAAELAAQGYVRPLPAGASEYFGLDGATLLSDEFLETHCFRIEDPGRGQNGVIGLHFEPIPTHTMADITGVLWMDRNSAELRYLEFKYTRHFFPVELPSEPFGGRVEFRRLENGAWVVDRWHLRMPQLPANFTPTGAALAALPLGALYSERDRLRDLQRNGLRIWEEGAQLRYFLEPREDGRGRAQVEGVLFDSTRARPLAGATVFLTGNQRSVRTDAQGRFVMKALPQGENGIAFLHPYADSLGLSVTPVPISLQAGEVTRVPLAIPPGPGCKSPYHGEEEGAVTGIVFDAQEGIPVSRALVRIRWRGGNSGGRGFAGSQRDLSMRTGPDGRFLFCGFPPGLDFELDAQHRRGSGYLKGEVEAPGLTLAHLLIR